MTECLSPKSACVGALYMFLDSLSFAVDRTGTCSFSLDTV